MLKRPTLWRFHSKGDEVRRGVWLLDTQRSGLQPYSEESATILEDAYLFLKWSQRNKQSQTEDESIIDSVLLTVQVTHGDESQLVQFRSLNQITASQKSVAGGFSLFKRRVYRGIQNDEDEVQNFNSNGDKPPAQIFREEVYDRLPKTIAAPIPLVKAFPHTNNLYQERVDKEDDVDHLVLVVHGVGEMLRAGDLLGLSMPAISASIIDCCDSLRENHVQVTEKIEAYSDHGRVEFLPIEWHEPFAIKSRGPQVEGQQSGQSATLTDISLDTIPHLRNFANDTMLDILFFMSPKHHDLMVDIVCTELNTVVVKYRKLTGFEGKISLLSHSLGSVISWDILSNEHRSLGIETRMRSQQGGSRPELSNYEKIPPSLNFEVECSFMIGSPVAVFLMMRNQNETSSSNIQLPGCNRVYNIFHPFDPVAYRIEPLIHSTNSKIEPEIIPNWKGGLRVKYKTQLWWRKIIDETEKAKRSAIMAVEAGIEGIGLLDEAEDEEFVHGENTHVNDVTNAHASNSEDIGQDGSLSKGYRLDYMIQEKEIEIANEYIAALAAHSSYWGEKDLSLFVLEQIYSNKQ